MGNSSSVYATAKPLEGSVDDFTNGQKASDMMYRKMGIERENEIAKQNQAIQEQKDKKVADLEKDINGKTVINTNMAATNLEDMKYKLISQASDLLDTTDKELLEGTKNGTLSIERKSELYQKRTKLLNTAVDFKSGLDTSINRFTGYEKEVLEGKIHPDYQYEALMKMTDGAIPMINSKGETVIAFPNKVTNGKVENDANGNPIIHDKNGDGKIDDLDFISVSEFQQGLPQFQFKEKFDTKDIDTEIRKGISYATNGGDNGTNTHLYKNATQAQVSEYVINTLLNPDGTVNPKGYSYAIEKGYNPEDKDSINEMISTTSKVFFNSTPKVNKEGTVKPMFGGTITETGKKLSPEGIAFAAEFEKEYGQYPPDSFLEKYYIKTTKSEKVPVGGKPKTKRKITY